MAMWAPSSVDGAIELSWSLQDYEIGFERRVTFRQAANTVRIASAGGPNASGVTTCRSTLEPWGREPGDYHLVDGEPLLWLVDDDVIASIDLPARAHAPAAMWVEGDGVRGHRETLLGQIGEANLELLAAAYDSNVLAPSSVLSLDARAELAGSLSLLTIEQWPERWSLTYHWVGDPSYLDSNLISPLRGLVQSSAPDGRTWRGIPGGGGSGSNGHSHGSLDFVGHLDDDVTELRLEWPGRDGRSRLTVDLTWQHPDGGARSQT